MGIMKTAKQIANGVVTFTASQHHQRKREERINRERRAMGGDGNKTFVLPEGAFHCWKRGKMIKALCSKGKGKFFLEDSNLTGWTVLQGSMFALLSDGGGLAALVVKKSSDTFSIYAPSPVFEGQLPSKTIRYKEESVFLWASVSHCDDAFMGPSISMWNGDFDLEHQAFATRISGGAFRFERISVLEDGGEVCHSQYYKERGFLGKGGHWKCTVSSQVDSVLMICFLAILDEGQLQRIADLLC